LLLCPYMPIRCCCLSLGTARVHLQLWYSPRRSRLMRKLTLLLLLPVLVLPLLLLLLLQSLLLGLLF